MKNKLFLLLKIAIPIITVFVFGVAFSSLNQQFEVTGKSNIVYIPSPNLVFDHTTSSSNQGAWRTLNTSVTISNTGDGPSYSWEFNMSIPDDATNISCWGLICTQYGASLNLKNESYNGIISPGENTTGGITLTTKNPDFVPEDPVEEEPDDTNLSENVTVVFNQTGTWGNGNNRTYQYDAVITNNNDVDIAWWRFDIAKDVYDFTVASIWNADYLDSSINVKLSNLTWNGAIAPGGSTSVGMQLKHKDRNFTISPSMIRAGN